VICSITAALVFLWPTGDERSLAVKAVNFLVDPFGSLPVLPEPLPMSLGDDADAVTAHDAQEFAYYEAYEGSALNRVRMDLRGWRPPLEPSTQRQALIALGFFGLLLTWRLGGSPPEASSENS